MEKVAYRLLKSLYKTDLTKADVDALTEFNDDRKINPYISYLSRDNLITSYSVGEKQDGAGGFLDGVEYLRITLSGRDYIEKRRKELLMFWIPYAITTAIAIAALIG